MDETAALREMYRDLDTKYRVLVQLVQRVLAPVQDGTEVVTIITNVEGGPYGTVQLGASEVNALRASLPPAAVTRKEPHE